MKLNFNLKLVTADVIFTDDILQVAVTSDGLIWSKCFDAKSAFFKFNWKACCVSICVSWGVGRATGWGLFSDWRHTLRLCVFLLGWGLDGNNGDQHHGQLPVQWLKGHVAGKVNKTVWPFFIYVLIKVSMYPSMMFESTVWSRSTDLFIFVRLQCCGWGKMLNLRICTGIRWPRRVICELLPYLNIAFDPFHDSFLEYCLK